MHDHAMGWISTQNKAKPIRLLVAQQLSSNQTVNWTCKDMEVNAEQVGKVVWNVETCEAVNICQTWG
jgi:hypothetical protein